MIDAELRLRLAEKARLGADRDVEQSGDTGGDLAQFGAHAEPQRRVLGGEAVVVQALTAGEEQGAREMETAARRR